MLLSFFWKTVITGATWKKLCWKNFNNNNLKNLTI